MQIRIFGLKGDKMEEKRESLGETLKKLRKTQRMTQKMLAEGICAQSVISRVENNEELPNVVILKQICQRLDVTMDQLMQVESQEINEINDQFYSIHQQFIQRKYVKVMALIKDETLVNSLYLEHDFQLYDYYSSVCAFYVEQKPIKALELLKKAISYTHNRENPNISPIEIQMMADLGRMYQKNEQFDLAQMKLEKAYRLIEVLPCDRKTFELNKIYYYLGELLFELKRYSEAAKIVREGMAAARKCCSYYYLEELFELNGRLLQISGQTSEGNEYFKRAKMLQRIVRS